MNRPREYAHWLFTGWCKHGQAKRSSDSESRTKEDQ